jgi:hypothetical protein
MAAPIIKDGVNLLEWFAADLVNMSTSVRQIEMGWPDIDYI